MVQLLQLLHMCPVTHHLLRHMPLLLLPVGACSCFFPVLPHVAGRATEFEAARLPVAACFAADVAADVRAPPADSSRSRGSLSGNPVLLRCNNGRGSVPRKVLHAAFTCVDVSGGEDPGVRLRP